MTRVLLAVALLGLAASSARSLQPTAAPRLDCVTQPLRCSQAIAWARERRAHDALVIRRLRRALARRRRQRANLPHRSQLLCIHGHEGPWDANTGNGYYGGLQMDASFEATYGPAYVARWGHASNWPPVFQMLAAERAIRVRGYSPWPNTARMCGLLP